MAYTGEKYVGDLALYYIAKKLESGKTTGSVKEAISQSDIDKQLRGDFTGAEPAPGATLGLPYNQPQGRATKFTQGEINSALAIAERLFKSYKSESPTGSGINELDLYESAQNVSKEIVEVEKQVGQLEVPAEATGTQEARIFQNALNEVMKKSVSNTLSESGQLERDTFLNALGLEAGDTNKVADQLFTTVRLGKTTMTELSASLGQVLPFARSAGLGLDGVGAAMATLTASGISTAQATTSFGASLTSSPGL